MADVSPPLLGLRVFIVEDEYLLAEAIAEALEDAGANVIGPVGTTAEGLAVIATETRLPDLVILDVNLHGERSYPIADALICRSVPIIFLTGYGAEALDERYRVFPRLEKPFEQSDLFALLRQV